MRKTVPCNNWDVARVQLAEKLATASTKYDTCGKRFELLYILMSQCQGNFRLKRKSSSHPEIMNYSILVRRKKLKDVI